MAPGLPRTVVDRAYMPPLLSADRRRPGGIAARLSVLVAPHPGQWLRARRNRCSDGLGDAQVREDQVVLRDVGDLEVLARREPVADDQCLLGGALHGLPALVGDRGHGTRGGAVDERADAAEAGHLLQL